MNGHSRQLSLQFQQTGIIQSQKYASNHQEIRISQKFTQSVFIETNETPTKKLESNSLNLHFHLEERKKLLDLL